MLMGGTVAMIGEPPAPAPAPAPATSEPASAPAPAASVAASMAAIAAAAASNTSGRVDAKGYKLTKSVDSWQRTGGGVDGWVDVQDRWRRMGVCGCG